LARLTDRPIDTDALVREVADVEQGGVCLFLGTARRRSEGKEVELLRYDAYSPMAEKVIEEILAETMRRFPDARVTAMHRLGPCPIGEASVAVVAAAPHRDSAFAACRFAIDTLKKDAPIWKQEVFRDGTAWVGDPGSFQPKPPEGKR
jgi:molybdopterin synthase catalytic subunit